VERLLGRYAGLVLAAPVVLLVMRYLYLHPELYGA